MFVKKLINNIIDLQTTHGINEVRYTPSRSVLLSIGIQMRLPWVYPAYNLTITLFCAKEFRKIAFRGVHPDCENQGLTQKYRMIIKGLHQGNEKQKKNKIYGDIIFNLMDRSYLRRRHKFINRIWQL
jgi:hypothetical protein